MSKARPERIARKTQAPPHDLQSSAPIFAALGDETRLGIVVKLCTGERCSIAALTVGSALTRQAVTKHLRILEEAGIVRGVRSGRENLFELEPARLAEARRSLDEVSRQWDAALARLKAYVEK